MDTNASLGWSSVDCSKTLWIFLESDDFIETEGTVNFVHSDAFVPNEFENFHTGESKTNTGLYLSFEFVT
jgi:GMP synthase-like glutamine amidotransferase